MVMKRYNLYDLKTHLSRHMASVEAGEILVCKRNVPIAEIRPIAHRRTERRPIGLAKGRFMVPASFDDPLEDEVLDAFEEGGA